MFIKTIKKGDNGDRNEKKREKINNKYLWHATRWKTEYKLSVQLIVMQRLNFERSRSSNFTQSIFICVVLLKSYTNADTTFTIHSYYKCVLFYYYKCIVKSQFTQTKL